MFCVKPYHPEIGVSVGCGQCLPCRINRRRQWTARILLETYCYPNSCFVTLTYDPQWVPKDSEGRDVLCRADLQLWLKRFRKKFGKCRFFGVGEYGKQTHRPHYHVVLFGVPVEAGPLIQQTWGMGFTSASEMLVQRAHYVAGYTTKKMVVDDEWLDGRPPEFARMSLKPGIGAPALKWLVDRHKSTKGQIAVELKGDVLHEVRIEGKKWPLDGYMLENLREELKLGECKKTRKRAGTLDEKKKNDANVAHARRRLRNRVETL